MREPIQLHFYNKDNEVVKTYSQHRVTWKFFKKAVKFENVNITDKSGVDIIADFVCEFFDYRFSIFGKKANKRKLLKYTDVDQLVAVAGAIVQRVISVMKENGVALPNAQTATE